MKLNKSKLLETLRRLNNESTAYQARKVAGISVRRVYQIKQVYKEIGDIPEIGKKLGRPRKMIEEWEISIVREAYEKYRVSADTLERLIERDYKRHIAHNRIHKILIQLGYAKPKKNKDVRKKKWIRYERKHSLTAVHLDWYYDDKTETWVLPVLDDSSRKLLALIEVESATTDSSIDAMNEALKHGEIQQAITDHGTPFIKGEDDKARFPAFLKQHNLKHIFCRIKHPQSNGKLEKFNDLYKNHRHAFKTKEEFIKWYNQTRPHMSLDDKTPEQPILFSFY